jgi:hypothetical protein
MDGVPASAMTMKSLKAWAKERGQSKQEKMDRELVVWLLTDKSFLKPRTLKKIENLELNEREYLTSLPPGLSVPGYLGINNCTALTHLPKGLSVGGSCDLFYCPALTQVPEGLSIGISLQIAVCPALTQLPAGLSIPHDLTLSSCSALTQLPEGLSVGRDLILDRCISLAQLPEGLSVGGRMSLRNCTSLTQLPEYVLQWPVRNNGRPHDIDLSGSGIYAQRAQALARIAGPGVQLIHDVREERRANNAQFANLPAAMDFWRTLASSEAQRAAPNNGTASNLNADPQQRGSFLLFLNRLRDTADYQNVSSRPLLAQRIVGLIDQLAASERLAALCHERIGQALESCGDRVIWAMNQLELAVHVHQAQQGSTPEQALRTLGQSLLRLQVVHQHAAAKVASLRVVDPIEVYLAYETRLAQPLGLPLSTRGMLYERCANVDKADLDAASRAAKQADADPRQVEAYLSAWEPWQGLMRRQQAEACTWQNLPPLDQGVELNADQVCILTQETVEDLQASGSQVAALRDANGQWKPYEFKSLLRWWAQQGTHPVQRTPMRLEDVRRMGDSKDD